MTDNKELTAKELAERFAAVARGKPDTELEQVVDDATRAELERWFGLPSFEAAGAARAPVAADDPEMLAARARRDAAIAAVDPALLAAIHARLERPETLIQFRASIDVRVDPSVALFDPDMVKRSVAEPRERELPEEMADDLKECTPQALLRDLHRAELMFDKTFEIVDMAAEQRFDIVAAVSDAMKTNWKLPRLDASPAIAARAMLDELRAERRQSWPALVLKMPLPNRRVSE